MAPTSSSPPSEPVRTHADLLRHSGRLSDVIGTYILVDVRKDPEAPPREPVHAALQLADSTLIYLQPPWEASAVRPVEERQQYAGKEVVVTGIVFAEGLTPPEGGAGQLGPCFQGEVSVVERSFWELMRGGDGGEFSFPKG